MENLSETLGEPALHSESLEILRGLIERIVVTPTAKGLEVELVGEIAKMMKLSGGPESLEREPYLSSVKVVAGTRNQRDSRLRVLV